MSDLSDMLSPNMMIRDPETKKKLIALKIKSKYRYILFQRFEDNITPEVKTWLEPMWEKHLRVYGRATGCPAYDYREVQDAIEGQSRQFVEELIKSGAKQPSTGSVFVKDVEIKVFDHISKSIKDLTIGLSIASESLMDKMIKENEAP